MDSPKDKIVVQVDDTPAVSEFVSRLEPGDKVTGKFSASLDENAEGIAIFSIDSINFNGQSSASSDNPEGEEPAAVKVFKDKATTDEEETEDTDEDGM